MLNIQLDIQLTILLSGEEVSIIISKFNSDKYSHFFCLRNRYLLRTSQYTGIFVRKEGEPIRVFPNMTCFFLKRDYLSKYNVHNIYSNFNFKWFLIRRLWFLRLDKNKNIRARPWGNSIGVKQLGIHSRKINYPACHASGTCYLVPAQFIGLFRLFLSGGNKTFQRVWCSCSQIINSSFYSKLNRWRHGGVYVWSRKRERQLRRRGRQLKTN